MSELDLPVYAIDPLYRVDMRCDGVVRWDYERMIERTEPYCKWLDIGFTSGWFSSMQFTDDMLDFTCLN